MCEFNAVYLLGAILICFFSFFSQPVPLVDIEQVTLVKVLKDDQISSTVTLYLQNTVQKVNTVCRAIVKNVSSVLLLLFNFFFLCPLLRKSVSVWKTEIPTNSYL